MISRGSNGQSGASNSQGPAGAQHGDWQLRELLDSQPNQWRDGQ